MSAVDVLKQAYNEELPVKLLAGDHLPAPKSFITLDDLDRNSERFPRCKIFADCVREWLKETK